MQKELKDIQFITLPDDRTVGDVKIDSSIPVPVQIPEGKTPKDIDFNSVVAGLIKVVAWKPENKNIEYYKKLLLKMRPDAVRELNLAAIAKSEKKEFEFAEEMMLAVNRLSEATESYVNLAVLYAQMTVQLRKDKKDVQADMYDDKILQILNECKEKYENYAPVYSEISAFHMRHGDVENARDYLAKYTELETNSKKKVKAKKTLVSMNSMLESKDRIMYAYDKMMMGCADEALDIMNKYIAGNEKQWESFFIRGWAKRVLEDYAGAQTDLLESLRIDGRNAEVYNELSICARESGDTELAKSYLQIAVDLDDEDTVYLLNLAFLHLASKEYAECRELLEKARVLDPEDPQLKYLIDEYSKQTGDKVGDIILEQPLSNEEFEDLRQKGAESGIPYKEI
ncbi:MAG: tetratricopeptide repeat protein [Spirochaetales bacterium]